MSATIELAPVEYTSTPSGVMHLVSANPEDYMTLCGVIIRETWTISDEVLKESPAICLPCHAELRQRKTNVSLGNYVSTEGVDRCPCGSKHWLQDHCADCGAEWTPETRDNS